MRNGAVVRAVPGSAAAIAESQRGPTSESRRRCSRGSRSNARIRGSKRGYGTVSRVANNLPRGSQVSNPGNPTRQRIRQEECSGFCECKDTTNNGYGGSELEKEAAQLRAENAALRTKNKMLQQQVNLIDAFPPHFDDPFEPPPEVQPPIPTVPTLPLWAPSPSSPTDSTSTLASEHFSTDLQTTDEAKTLQCRGEVQHKSSEPSVVNSSLDSITQTVNGKVSQRWGRHIPSGIVQHARARFQ